MILHGVNLSAVRAGLYVGGAPTLHLSCKGTYLDATAVRELAAALLREADAMAIGTPVPATPVPVKHFARMASPNTGACPRCGTCWDSMHRSSVCDCGGAPRNCWSCKHREAPGTGKRCEPCLDLADGHGYPRWEPAHA